MNLIIFNTIGVILLLLGRFIFFELLASALWKWPYNNNSSGYGELIRILIVRTLWHDMGRKRYQVLVVFSILDPSVLFFTVDFLYGSQWCPTRVSKYSKHKCTPITKPSTPIFNYGTGPNIFSKIFSVAINSNFIISNCSPCSVLFRNSISLERFTHLQLNCWSLKVSPFGFKAMSHILSDWSSWTNGFVSTS